MYQKKHKYNGDNCPMTQNSEAVINSTAPQKFLRLYMEKYYTESHKCRGETEKSQLQSINIQETLK